MFVFQVVQSGKMNDEMLQMRLQAIAKGDMSSLLGKDEKETNANAMTYFVLASTQNLPDGKDSPRNAAAAAAIADKYWRTLCSAYKDDPMVQGAWLKLIKSEQKVGEGTLGLWFKFKTYDNTVNMDNLPSFVPEVLKVLDDYVKKSGQGGLNGFGRLSGEGMAIDIVTFLPYNLSYFIEQTGRAALGMENYFSKEKFGLVVPPYGKIWDDVINGMGNALYQPGRGDNLFSIPVNAAISIGSMVFSITTIPSWMDYWEAKEKALKNPNPLTYEAASLAYNIALVDTAFLITIALGAEVKAAQTAGKELVWTRAYYQLLKKEMVEKGLGMQEAEAAAKAQIAALKSEVKMLEGASKDVIPEGLGPKKLNEWWDARRARKPFKPVLEGIGEGAPKTRMELATFISERTGIVIEMPTVGTTLKEGVKSLPAAVKDKWTKFSKGRMAAEVKREIRYERYLEIFGIINPEKEVVGQLRKEAVEKLISAQPKPVLPKGMQGAQAKKWIRTAEANMRKAAEAEVDRLLAQSRTLFPSRIAENFNATFKDAGLKIENAAELSQGWAPSLSSPPKKLMDEMRQQLIMYYQKSPEKMTLKSAEAQAEADISAILRQEFINELNIISTELASKGANVAPNLRSLLLFSEMQADRTLLGLKGAKKEFDLMQTAIGEIQHTDGTLAQLAAEDLRAAGGAAVDIERVKKVRITMLELRKSMSETHRLLFKEPAQLGKEGKKKRLEELQAKIEADTKVLKAEQAQLKNDMSVVQTRMDATERGTALKANRSKLEGLKKQHGEMSADKLSEREALEKEMRGTELDIATAEKAQQKTVEGKKIAKLQRRNQALEDAIASTEKFKEGAEASLWSIVTTYARSTLETFWKSGRKDLPPGSPKWMTETLEYIKKYNLIVKYRSLSKELAKIAPEVAALDKQLSETLLNYTKSYCEANSMNMAKLTSAESFEVRRKFFSGLLERSAAGDAEAEKILQLFNAHDRLDLLERTYRLQRNAIIGGAVVAAGAAGYWRYGDLPGPAIPIAMLADAGGALFTVGVQLPVAALETTMDLWFLNRFAGLGAAMPALRLAALSPFEQNLTKQAGNPNNAFFQPYSTRVSDGIFNWKTGLVANPEEEFRQNVFFQEGTVIAAPDSSTGKLRITWPALDDPNITAYVIYKDMGGARQKEIKRFKPYVHEFLADPGAQYYVAAASDRFGKFETTYKITQAVSPEKAKSVPDAAEQDSIRRAAAKKDSLLSAVPVKNDTAGAGGDAGGQSEEKKQLSWAGKAEEYGSKEDKSEEEKALVNVAAKLKSTAASLAAKPVLPGLVGYVATLNTYISSLMTKGATEEDIYLELARRLSENERKILTGTSTPSTKLDYMLKKLDAMDSKPLQ